MIRFCTFSAALILALPANLLAQKPVPVGKGSYAEFPPASAGSGPADMIRRKIPLVGNPDRPIPTNKLWTWLLGGKASGSLWMYPWRVDPKPTGIELFFPVKWQANGSDPLCDSPLKVTGVDFKATGVLMKDWGDWTFSFRLPESEKRYLDITLGEGMPLAWVEAEGVELALKADRDAKFTQADGTAVNFPFDGDRLIVSSSERLYGVYVPRGTHFSQDGKTVRLGFPAGKHFAAFAALKQPSDLTTFAKAAFSIPRNSRVDWSYDAPRGKVKTTWTVETEPLVAGSENVVVQGWLAHQWRDATYSMKLDGPEYLTPRGTMKTAIGNRFELDYDFAGFLPCLPAPEKLGLPNDFDPERMKYLLERCARSRSMATIRIGAAKTCFASRKICKWPGNSRIHPMPSCGKNRGGRSPIGSPTRPAKKPTTSHAIPIGTP